MESSIARPRLFVEQLEAWAANHARATAIGIVLVSALLRVGYLTEIYASPCVAQHRWTKTDMNFFDRWARAIAAGDVWTDASVHPYHAWHRTIATEHFRTHPDDRALDPAVAAGREPGQVLWNRWYGGKTFHQEPLYPYLVALSYFVFGADVRVVFVWQAIAGSLTNLLIFAIARRVFGPLAGLVAGVLAVLCAPLLYYEAILLRETLIVTATLALVYSGLRAFERRSWGAWLVFGVVGGMSLLVKTTFLPFLLMVALVAVVGLWRERRAPSTALQALSGLAAGVALCLAPAIVRNCVVGAPPSSLSSVGPVTFASANTVDYRPEIGFFASTVYLPRIMAESEGAPVATAVAALRTHANVLSYLDLLRHKLLALWHWYELPNNSNFYFYRLYCPVLRILPVGFTFAAPLGLLGMILAWKRRRSAWLLYWAVATSASTMLLFYVLSRFRLPFLAALLPFAAFAIVELLRWALNGRLFRLAVAMLATVALAVWTARPLPANTALIRSADWLASYTVGYGPQLNEALKRDDWPAIAGILDRALQFVPQEIERVVATGKLSEKNDAALVLQFTQVYELHARAMSKLGRDVEARRSEERFQILRESAPPEPPAGNE